MADADAEVVLLTGWPPVFTGGMRLEHFTAWLSIRVAAAEMPNLPLVLLFDLYGSQFVAHEMTHAWVRETPPYGDEEWVYPAWLDCGCGRYAQV